jgi:poly(A) polymerase
MRRSQRLSSLHSHPQFSAALGIVEKLKSKGHEAYFAGGSVRDAWMGRPAQDFDIATSAEPNAVEKIFSKTVPVGKEFGVMVVVVPAGSFEVASFRHDGPYLDGRRPAHVKFTNAEEDAKRRDFTMNALFYDPVTEETIDYVGGLKDIEKKVIRTVGVASERFGEDKLRMLRAIRFVAQLGFAIEGETLTAIQARASEITQVSSERVFMEMSKLLRSPYWIRGLELLKVGNLARYIWPEWSFSADANRLRGIGLPLNWEHAFACVMWIIKSPKQADMRLSAWKAPKQSVRKVQNILSSLHSLFETDLNTADRLRILDGPDFAEILNIAKLHLLRLNKNVDSVDQWISEYLVRTGEEGKLPSPFLSGDDLVQLGFPQDKNLGQTLKLLYDEQLMGEINSKEEALERAKALRQP